MNGLKNFLKTILPGDLYNRLWRTWDAARRLFIYPQITIGPSADYDAYWKQKAAAGMGKLSSWRRARAATFAQVIEPGAVVLDLACGDGAILKYVTEVRDVEAYGIDLSSKAVDFARGQGLTVMQGDVSGPLPDGLDREYDYIILSEIIEHLPDPEALLLRLGKRTRRALIVSIPNTGWWQHRLRLALGRFPLQWVVFPGEHLRFWTLTDFRWWAGALGLELVEIHPYRGVPGLRKVWPGLFAQGIVYVLKPAGSLGEAQ